MDNINKRLARGRDCFERLDCLEDSFWTYQVCMRLFSAYLCNIVEEVTSASDIFPQIVTLEDPPIYRDDAPWKELRQYTQVNPYRVLHDIKRRNVMGIGRQ